MTIPDAEPLDDHDPAVIGPYTLLGRLGEGGMGVVYLARAVDGPQVALKVINGSFARKPEFAKFKARFLEEVRAARQVARCYTAEVLDVNTEGGQPYLATELIDGPTLKTEVEEHGPLSGARLERLAVDVLSALKAIHKAHLVHCDLKPNNIMYSSSGLKVIDFGIARALDTTVTLAQRGMGTPAFMAPEQVNERPATSAADIHAWGGVVLFAGTGRTPFGEEGSPLAIMYRVVHRKPDLTGLDDGLRALVAEAMNKNPARRPTADELTDRLLRCMPGAGSGRPPLPPPAVPGNPDAPTTPHGLSEIEPPLGSEVPGGGGSPVPEPAPGGGVPALAATAAAVDAPTVPSSSADIGPPLGSNASDGGGSPVPEPALSSENPALAAGVAIIDAPTTPSGSADIEPPLGSNAPEGGESPVSGSKLPAGTLDPTPGVGTTGGHTTTNGASSGDLSSRSKSPDADDSPDIELKFLGKTRASDRDAGETAADTPTTPDDTSDTGTSSGLNTPVGNDPPNPGSPSPSPGSTATVSGVDAVLCVAVAFIGVLLLFLGL